MRSRMLVLLSTILSTIQRGSGPGLRWPSSMLTPVSASTLLASTNYLDSEWQKVKRQIPAGIGVMTLGGVRTKMNYVRAAQWRMMTRGEDKWQVFCEAARAWTDGPIVPEVAEGLVVPQGEQLEVVPPGEPPFGFEATGEAHLLASERALRSQFNAPASGNADPAGWLCDKDEDDSDATEQWDDSVAVGDKGLVDDSVDSDSNGMGSEACDDFVDSGTEATRIRKRPAMDPELAKRDADRVLWGDRYFEVQEDLKCGRHAINNMLGRPQFTDDDFLRACLEVCQETGDSPSQHVAKRGWYSHSVIALMFDITAPPIGVLLLEPATESAYDMLMGDDYHGLLVNLHNRHWVSIVKHNGTLFYVDSLHQPVSIGFHDFSQIICVHPMGFLVAKHVG